MRVTRLHTINDWGILLLLASEYSCLDNQPCGLPVIHNFSIAPTSAVGREQVRFEFGKLSYQKLKDAGANVTFEQYQGMGHEVVPQEVQKMEAFWQTCLNS